ncbi:MAG: iron complex outermembrane receptor protein, partial [Gammaproteobacteria bacterium]
MKPLKFNKLSYAIITALSASSFAMAQEATDETEAGRVIETIQVTATKRTESIQAVPVTVSALSGDALENLGVDNFQDYVEFLPNVVFQG